MKIILLIKFSNQRKTNLTEKLEKRIKYENQSGRFLLVRCMFPLYETYLCNISFTYCTGTQIWIPRFYLSCKNVSKFVIFNILWHKIPYLRGEVF